MEIYEDALMAANLHFKRTSCLLMLIDLAQFSSFQLQPPRFCTGFSFLALSYSEALAVEHKY